MIIKFTSHHCNTRGEKIRVQIDSGAMKYAYIEESDVGGRPFWKGLDLVHASQAVLDRFERTEEERRSADREEKKEPE